MTNMQWIPGKFYVGRVIHVTKCQVLAGPFDTIADANTWANTNLEQGFDGLPIVFCHLAEEGDSG